MKNLFFLTAVVALTALFAGCNRMDAPEVGITINGVTWATRNVDAPGQFAAKPQDAGMFYQWNRSKAWPVSGSVTDWPVTPASGTTWEAANDPCPDGWRVPTKTEIESLLAVSVPQKLGKIAGVAGFYLGSAPNRIFLPAVGFRFSNGNLNSAGWSGFWSSTSASSNEAWIFSISIDFQSIDTLFIEKDRGMSVRCVKN